MAKQHRRKPSPAQLSEYNRSLARVSNAALGTKFNLRKKALSRYALRKVRAFSEKNYFTEDAVPKARFRALPAPSRITKEAKAKGFEVIGRNIVVPNRPLDVRRFRKNIALGRTPGFSRIGEMGFMHVVLPFNIRDMADLIAAMDNGTLDSLKEPDDYFAFKYFGKNSHRPFPDAEDMRQYLTTYKSIFDAANSLRNEDLAEEFESFELFRIDPEVYDWKRSPPSKSTKTKHDRRSRTKTAVERALASRAERSKVSSAERMREARAIETPAHKIARLASQRQYQRAYRKRDKK